MHLFEEENEKTAIERIHKFAKIAEAMELEIRIGFSGGKDSTVLLWLARKIYPDIKAVFCNTGNEYPDIVRFVRGMKDDGMNIDIIHPKIKPKDVIANYGFPLVSKETSEKY